MDESGLKHLGLLFRKGLFVLSYLSWWQWEQAASLDLADSHVGVSEE